MTLISQIQQAAFLLCISALIGGCTIWSGGGRDFDGLDVPAQVNGVRPIYLDTVDFAVSSEEPRVIINGTGVISLGTRLFIVDSGIGIHVIDNTDPVNPIPIQFISIPGVTTATVLDEFIYADFGPSLLTIDISDLSNAFIADRDDDLFSNTVDFPQNYIGYFECYNSEFGYLLGWEESTLSFPQCHSL